MSQDGLDAALDVIAEALRAIARYPIPLGGEGEEDPSQISAKWAEHILKLAIPPGAAQPLKTRDYVGVRKFFVQLRQRESEQVSKSHQGLRESIWEFAKTLSQFFSDSRHSDERVKMQLDKLRSAAENADASQLRTEMMAAVGAIGDVLEERRQQHVQAMADLGKKVKELSVELETAKRDAAEDPLTHLPDRRIFDEELERVSQIDVVLGRQAVILIIDVDHFKGTNDSHGHAAGDQVLKHVADCISRTFIRRGDCIVRFGGDEFAILLRDTVIKDAHMLAERFMVRLKEKAPFPVTVSIGLAETIQGQSGSAWFERADRALYDAKRSGRNRVVDSVKTTTPNSSD